MQPTGYPEVADHRASQAEDDESIPMEQLREDVQMEEFEPNNVESNDEEAEKENRN